MSDFIELLAKPYFNCTDDSFALLDTDQVKRDISSHRPCLCSGWGQATS